MEDIAAVKVLKTVVLVVGVVAAVVATAGLLAPVAVGAALGSVGLTLATVSAIATAASIAGGILTTLTAKKPSSLVGGSATDWKADPQAGIPYMIGRTFNAGNIVKRESWGKDNEWQGFTTVYSLGPVANIEQFTADRTPINFAGGNAIGGMAGWMFLWLQLGLAPTPAPMQSVAGYPGWSASSKLSGLAASNWFLKFDKKDGKKYSLGIPAPGVIGGGVLVYDPRLDDTQPGGSGACRAGFESTYVSSESPALHTLTWALGRYQNGKRRMGVGFPASSIDMQSFISWANVCDANNWKIGGIVYSTDDKWNIMKTMAQAGGAEPMQLGGKLSVNYSAPRVSVATITSADMVGRGTVVASQKKRDRINGIVPRIKSEAHGWQVIPLDVVRVPVLAAEDGRERTKERDYQLVQQVKQGAELAAYDIYNAREFGPIELKLKVQYIGLPPGSAVTLDIPEMNLNGQKALLGQRTLDVLTGAVSMQLKSETDAKHPFCLGKTGVAPPTPSLTAPLELLTPAPEADDWIMGGVLLASASGQQPALRFAGTVDNVNAEGVIFDYRIAGTNEWIGGSIQGPNTTKHDITSLVPGESYEGSIRYIFKGVAGDRRITAPVATGALTGTIPAWSEVIDDGGKPDDNATVGAPAGTEVGGVLAETIVANTATALANSSSALTASQQAAADALNASNQATAAVNAAGGALASASAAAASQAAAEAAKVLAQSASTQASADAAIAESQKNAAVVAATSASGSATTATGQATIATNAANSAATSQSITATYTVDVLRNLKRTNPSDMTGGLTLWSEAGDGFFSGPEFRLDPDGTNRFADLYPRWAYPATPGVTYRITLDVYVTAVTNSLSVNYGWSDTIVDPDMTYEGGVSAYYDIPASASWQTKTFQRTVGPNPPKPYIWFYSKSEIGATGSLIIRNFLVEGVTSELVATAEAAVASSQAAASSASAATATTNASLSATYRDQAQGHATAALNQANISTAQAAISSAAGSTATTQASLSASHAANSLNSLKGTAPSDMSGGLAWYIATPPGQFVVGPYFSVQTNGAFVSSELYPEWAFPAISGRRYRITLDNYVAGANLNFIGVYYGWANAPVNPDKFGIGQVGGVTDAPSTYTWVQRSFEFVIPPNPPSPYLWLYVVTQISEAGTILLRTFNVEDVTSEVASSTSAAISSSQAATATAAAASATTNTALSATYRDQAAGSASSAAGSASDASSSSAISTSQAAISTAAVASATTQSSLSASHAANALTSLKRTHPSDMSGGSEWFGLSGSGVFSGSDFRLDPNGIGALQSDLYPKWAYPATAGQTYRITLEAYVTAVTNALGINFGWVNNEVNPVPTYSGQVGVLINTTPLASWQPYVFEYTIPPGPPNPFIFFYYFAQIGTTGSVLLRYFNVENVTSEKASATQASISTSQSAIATAAAASAQASQVLSASTSGGLLGPNTTFAAWPDGSPYPTHWTIGAGSGGDINRITNPETGAYALRMRNAPGVFNQYIQFNRQELEPIINEGGWYVMEADLKMVNAGSGSFSGSGMYIQFFNATNSYMGDAALTFATEFGVGVQGQTYRPRKIIQAPTGAKHYIAYAMNRWGGFGDNGTETYLDWYKCGLRAASPSEIRDQTVLLPMQATVSTHSSAIATLNGAVATQETIVAAGGGLPAVVRLKAGVGGSNVALAAETIYLINYLNGVAIPALTVSNGNALFSGGLQANAFIKLGSGNGWPVALKTQDFTVADGTVVSFGTNLGGLPAVDFLTVGLAPLAAGEVYDLYTDSLSATGFTARLKINVPGTVTNYNLTVDSNPGSGPTRQIDIAGNPQATSGTYTYTVSGSISVNDVYDGDYWAAQEGQGYVDFWVKKAGAWQKVSTQTVTAYSNGSGPPAEITNYTISQTFNLGSGVEAFGASAGSPSFSGGAAGHSVNDLNSVNWSVTASSGVRTATPSGQTSKAKVTPQ